MAGYSKRSLADKLGIKEGLRTFLLNPPEAYSTMIGERLAGVLLSKKLQGPVDFIHFFTKEKKELEKQFPMLTKALSDHGALWISWPKGSSKAATDLNENVVREVGLANGLVDTKVCAVDEVWSGLKFVRRVKDRKGSG